MKKKQKQEVRAKGIEELAKAVEKTEEEILRLRMDVRMARVKDTTSLKRKADELAVVKTILEEKRYFGKDKI